MERISPATDADLAALAVLHAQGFDEPWSEGALRTLMDSPGVFVLKSEVSEKISGFVMARMVLDEAEILTITVIPAVRGQGLAFRLMEAVIAHVLVSGITSLFLEVAEDNEAALALYMRLGFTGVGRRPAYYARSEGAVAALIMALKLS
ncbi:MAG: ribosomal protein S18-alanine N-acetyltransferase [Pseudomonadota bacterium]